MNHFLTRQLGLLQAQLEELHEADVFSDLADLEYLSKLQPRLRNLIKELAADGQVDKDPLGVLKKDWRRAKQWTTGLNDIVDKLDSSLNELKERKEWTEEELKEELSALGSSHEEFEKELDILNRKYFKKKADWTGAGINSSKKIKFDVLVELPKEKLNAIKLVQKVLKLGLKGSKDLIESGRAPQKIKIGEGESKKQVEGIKRRFEASIGIGVNKMNFNVMSTGSLNLLCPLLESFDLLEEEEGQGFSKLLNETHLEYLTSAKNFKDSYKTKITEAGKYLKSKQGLIKGASKIVKRAEQSWEDGDVQKVKQCLGELKLFPEFGHELKKSLDSYLKIQEEILDWENSIKKKRGLTMAADKWGRLTGAGKSIKRKIDNKNLFPLSLSEKLKVKLDLSDSLLMISELKEKSIIKLNEERHAAAKKKQADKIKKVFLEKKWGCGCFTFSLAQILAAIVLFQIYKWFFE
jgi:ribosomal protein L7/L12